MSYHFKPKKKYKWNLLKMSIITWIIFLLCSNVFCTFSVVAGSSEPNSKTFFEYEYKQGVDNCDGIYDEYSEETKGTGRYNVISWGPENATMFVDFSWEYSNNEGDSKSGGTRNEFSFSLSTREYTSHLIDIDDFYYGPDPQGTLYQWLWIPPDIKEGETVNILDGYGTVTDTDATVWSRFIPRKVIEVVVKGSHYRNDDYGIFDFDFTDKLYFDQDTGMFFAERYEEWDDGTFEGKWAEFRLFIEIDVTNSSYEVEIDWYELITIYSLVILTTLGLIFFFGYSFYRLRWVTRHYETTRVKDITKGKDVTNKLVARVRRVWKMKDLPHRSNFATDFFEPFLEHWAKKALMAKDRVAVAVSENYGLVGFALYNKEAKIGTVLCRSTNLTERLRSYIGCKDFFSETKHVIAPPERAMDSWQRKEIEKREGKDAFNIFETHNVYKLNKLSQFNYDTKLIRPMKKEDLPRVIKLAKRIFKTKAKRWIAASFNIGDLVYVATINGNIVGFGFAEVCGNIGRLHTLGVAPEVRGRGIGKELHRARLEAMQLLGVTEVIDEIADWNLASIRISMLSGFKKIGKMYVETSRRKRIKKNIVRR